MYSDYTQRLIVVWNLTAGVDGKNVQDILEKGLDDLMDLCDVVIEKFEEAKTEHENKMSD